MLLTVPQELLLIILVVLDPASQCLFSATCRTIKKLYKPLNRNMMTTSVIAQYGYLELLQKTTKGHPLDWLGAIHGGHLNCVEYLHSRYQYRLSYGEIETAACAGHTHILDWFNVRLRAFYMPSINTSVEHMLKSIEHSKPEIQTKVNAWLYSIGYRPRR